LSFLHLQFKGRTTSPWHIGRRSYRDYLYTREDYLWGRGVRGPILRQLWRTYCPRSDAFDGAAFVAERDCPNCGMAEDCPFWNLRGTDDEGEFKDQPRLIITNLRFDGGSVRKERVVLATVSDRHRGVVEGKAPVYIECLSEGAAFCFEVILMGVGAEFEEELRRAAEVSLRFLGWGGFCNEGFGRGEIEGVRSRGFEAFEHDLIEPLEGYIMEKAGEEALAFDVEPMLILDRDAGGTYRSILEEGFHEKLCNCINERYWQFYRDHIHLQLAVKGLSGRARTSRMRAWSRKLGREHFFEGVGGELIMHLQGRLREEEAKALALASYGVGRYKNQGFGTLRPRGWTCREKAETKR
jgi:hypothetical protein